VEQFNDRLLIKQEGENLQVVDINTQRVQEIDQRIFVTPSAFIFLYQTQVFLTFRQRMVWTWSFKGNLMTE
jgi:hypothetical protein